jgi:hypothetical protein
MWQGNLNHDDSDVPLDDVPEVNSHVAAFIHGQRLPQGWLPLSPY